MQRSNLIGAALIVLLATTAPAACGAVAEPPAPGAAERAATATYLPLLASSGYYVATGGDDRNPGSSSAPWRTIQKAADSVPPGSSVYVRGGVYREAVTINVSGSASAGYTTFQSYPGETAVIDGGGLAVPDEASGLFLISDRSYLVIKGFELRNYASATRWRVPVGIHVRGGAHHIELRDNTIHHIATNVQAREGGDAHAIAVYGTSGERPIGGLVIDGNELHSLRLGSSEALAINGNVDGFQITDNLIHDANNIGIDAIGYEGTAPRNDRARNGLIAGNRVWNIDSRSNPAYGATCDGAGVCAGGDGSAGGIYVDGGTGILIERNLVINANIGIELASEHAGTATDRNTVRSNIIADASFAGIAMGGYAADAGGPGGGSARDNVVVNNTVYTLAEAGGDQFGDADAFHAQHRVQDNTVMNNLFAAASGRSYVLDSPATYTGNVVSSNLQRAVGAGAPNPGGLFVSVATPTGAELRDRGSAAVRGFLHARAGGAAHNGGALRRPDGQPVAYGAQDIDGQARVVGGQIDLGADEVP